MAAASGAMMLGAGTAAPTPNKRMDQPSADVFKGSRMTERLALIQIRTERRVPREPVARRSCANR